MPVRLWQLKAPSPRRVSAPAKSRSLDNRFTFSSSPNSVVARPHKRLDFSHSAFHAIKIQEDNHKLCRRLVEISSSTKPVLNTRNFHTIDAAPVGRLAPANVAAANINRRKLADEIAQENLSFFKRLQAVKSTEGVSREALAKSYFMNQEYACNARKLYNVPQPMTLQSMMMVHMTQQPSTMEQAKVTSVNLNQS
ncbi:hypothetical protein CEUSTIGMA_g12533.t1 [Chlamydomonas eustigma]|uniref:Uncharacterized protein n=1 Tax=Chlamydomonas eustigma TaxID=1157962 RepID=A0A250XQ29_9CHLO|nr:hypothetical protein CEUSTIGMA_g12533.t1 [Chlamydomonas eustigma]|eukprot:GAX85113.1 hypothetical protein CEUSTIGMA_g12533.t1 [Chlamydomonas eustigma]